MKISLTNVGKRFNRDWIFRHLTYEFIAGNAYAITGPNGSGKSTLLQVIGGAVVASEGKTKYEVRKEKYEAPNSQSPIPHSLYEIQAEDVYQHISIAAPYLEVIEEMSLKEFLHFHAQFKPFIAEITIDAIIEKTGLSQSANKQMRYYSSGMKQRVKLAQAIFSNVPCILLDEPCTNLDAEGIALYQRLIEEYCSGRLVIVSSNDETEYGFCRERLHIPDFKQQPV